MLLVRKPAGMTSFGVVKAIRDAVGGLKTGHSGTLDPFAEGLLIIGIGRSATRQLGKFMEMEKEYIAEIAFGTATDTGDCTGEVICQEPYEIPDEGKVEEILHNLCSEGEIEQIPPMFSAIKVGGMRLYKAARKGIKVEVKPRKVKIYSLELLNLCNNSMTLKVVCSKGTYIRSLAVDIGELLGIKTHLQRLIRTRIGQFKLEDALSLESTIERVKNINR